MKRRLELYPSRPSTSGLESSPTPLSGEGDDEENEPDEDREGVRHPCRDETGPLVGNALERRGEQPGDERQERERERRAPERLFGSARRG